MRGELREYPIHTSSGNVLMPPGIRYLCLELRPGNSIDGLAILFEGDRMLSIVLSKAFLLVNDRKIKDKLIVQQIR